MAKILPGASSFYEVDKTMEMNSNLIRVKIY